MFDAVHHIAYVVPDLDRALELFKDQLGMTAERLWESEPEGNRYAAMRIGQTDTFLAVISPMSEHSRFVAFLDEHGPGVHHVAFRDEAFDGTLEALAADHGITGTDPIVSSSNWRISFLDSATTQGLELQLVDGRHADG